MLCILYLQYSLAAACKDKSICIYTHVCTFICMNIHMQVYINFEYKHEFPKRKREWVYFLGGGNAFKNTHTWGRCRLQT